MGHACDVDASAGRAGDSASSARVLQAFRARIGDDRFAVWFGDATCVVVPADGRHAARIVVAAGNGFTHDWLRRMFRGEFEAAARDTCGPHLEVAWEPQVAPAAPPVSTAADEAAAGRRPAARSGPRRLMAPGSGS
jgi:chromosomal replication initiation ATPase DnaA